MLLTCCFNTSTPELPAVWCLESRKGVSRPPPRIEGPYEDLVVVMRITSKPTISFGPRTIVRVVVPERVRCSTGGSGRIHLRYPSKVCP